MADTVLPDVSAEFISADGQPSVAIKIASPYLELNVWIPHAHVNRLEQVRDARWEGRGSIQLGQVAGAPAWWDVNPEQGTLAILVGHDAETWDVGAWWPLAALDEIIAEVRGCLDGPANGQDPSAAGRRTRG